MNKIKLYHYTNADIKDKIKIKYFGLNTYTSHSQSKINRIYVYLNDNTREHFLYGLKYKYIIEIDKNKLYNLEADILKLKNKYSNIDNLFIAIKNRGYLGIIGNNGLDIAILFNDVKFKYKIEAQASRHSQARAEQGTEPQPSQSRARHSEAQPIWRIKTWKDTI